MVKYACHACGVESESVTWVPRFPRGAFPFCAKPACQRTAQRRAAVAFSQNPRSREATNRAPVPG